MSGVEVTPAELRALLAKATPGPWSDAEYPEITGDGEALSILDPHGHGFVLACDTALIVAAVNALPALLDAIEGAIEYRKFAETHGMETIKDCARDNLDAALAKLETT